MRLAIRSHVSYANVVATIALVLAAGGGYAAAAVSGDRQVHGCVGKDQTLALRHGSHCRHSQRALNWSLQGPQGAAGRDGINGRDGAQGLQGAQGPQGPQGPGALSFSGSVPINNGFNPIAAANGVQVSMACDGFGHTNMRIAPASGAGGFFAFGTQVLDGTQTVVSTDPAGIAEDANHSIEVHVTVATSAAGGPAKLTRLDFSEINNAPTACPYRGLVVPGGPAS